MDDALLECREAMGIAMPEPIDEPRRSRALEMETEALHDGSAAVEERGCDAESDAYAYGIDAAAAGGTSHPFADVVDQVMRLDSLACLQKQAKETRARVSEALRLAATHNVLPAEDTATSLIAALVKAATSRRM